MATDGGPAFPRPPGRFDGVDLLDQQGMSLRDWFAGQALMGILSAPVVPDEPRAVLAYRYADAMLEARRAR